MQQFGPRFLFSYTSAVHAALIFVTLYRMRARAGVPADERKGFATLLRTSPVFFRLARRTENGTEGTDKT